MSINAKHEKVGVETLHEAGVKCAMAFPTGRKVVLPSGIDPAKLRLFYFRHDADVLERDRVVFNGRSYIVNSVDVTWGDHHKEALCETVLGG
jgi:hypothetical protein